MKRRHVASMDEVRITREGEYAVIEFADWWRITDMEIWDEEARDLLGPAYIEFGSDDMGEFRFIAVQGRMDCRFGRKDAKPLVKFSWQSSDEMDEASGRGWAVIEGSGELKGRIFFHQGDDSAFTATRRAPRPI
jgi:hypothetical protein